MVDQNILSNLQNPTNSVAGAYANRTNQLEAQREADAQKKQQAITQRDNDMLKVFEFAGDGRTEEAKFYANQKGLQIPDEVLSNADFAKGLTLAGKIYGDDPVAAQKFTTAWMQSGGGDFQSRLAVSQQAAGKVIDPADREYQRKIQFELWKQKNLPAGGDGKGGFNLSPGQTRYDAQGRPIVSIPAQPPISRFEAGQRAVQSALQGMASADAVEAARQQAYAAWDSEYGSKPAAGATGGVSQGLSGVPQAPQPPQIPSGLPQGRFSPEMSEAVYRDAITAINNGIPAQSVYERLKSVGLDPSVIQSSSANVVNKNPQVDQTVSFQKAPINFSEQEKSGVNLDRYGFLTTDPSSSRLERVSTGLINAVNVPASVNFLGDTIVRGSSAVGNAVGKGIESGAEIVGRGINNAVDYMQESPNIMVISPEGKTGWIPRNELDVALTMGYKLPSSNRLQAPIAR